MDPIDATRDFLRVQIAKEIEGMVVTAWFIRHAVPREVPGNATGRRRVASVQRAFRRCVEWLAILASLAERQGPPISILVERLRIAGARWWRGVVAASRLLKKPSVQAALSAAC
jgi:hypothetical protein